MNTRDKTSAAPVLEKKLVLFGGYQTSHVPGHDPELTDTPRFLKILGEELVYFNDGSGRIGVAYALRAPWRVA